MSQTLPDDLLFAAKIREYFGCISYLHPFRTFQDFWLKLDTCLAPPVWIGRLLAGVLGEFFQQALCDVTSKLAGDDWFDWIESNKENPMGSAVLKCVRYRRFETADLIRFLFCFFLSSQIMFLRSHLFIMSQGPLPGWEGQAALGPGDENEMEQLS